METRYSPALVALSFVVAIFASYVALNLVHSVTQAKGRSQTMWLACGAFAMGFGIWSMHFVGMLAFEMPGMEMAYDLPLMVLSVIVAIGASALALFVVSRPVVQTSSIVASGIAMAAAIAGMHYIGMFSMRMEARIEWNAYLVALSILIALVASFAALAISIKLRHNPDKFWLMGLASILMGVAIAGMHYTGMIAATFVHDHTSVIKASNLLVTSGLTVVVVTTTLFILVIALMGSIGHRVMTLRQRRSDEFQKRETQLRTITNAIPILVAQVDRNEKFLFANNSFCDWFGLNPISIRSAHARDVLGEERYLANKPYLDRAFAGETVNYERLSESGKRSAILSVTFVPELDGIGWVKEVIIVAADITKYKEIEAELKSAKVAAEVANETKSSFLANMSHEIRTPLGAVLGFAELMSEKEMTPEEKLETIKIIKRNGKLLSNIINDILDISKVEAGKLEIEKTEVVLEDILNEMSALLGLEADAKGTRLTIIPEGKLPSVIRTDPTRLRQILFNIVGNAIKFTEKGVVTVNVSIKSQYLLLQVSDTGVGIGREHQDRLFSPFTQADVTTTRRFGGTGLGLVLSKKLAIALGGNVELLTSRPGAGSTFQISIEHGRTAEELASNNLVIEKTLPGKTMAISPNALKEHKVLVVDDSPENLTLAKIFLSMAGAVVDTATNGKDGVEKAMRENFSVVLMDLQMPQMDGYEATKELRERGYMRPIIALTAHAMKDERKRCLSSGFTDHLTKPIDRDKLISAVLDYV